MLLLPQGLAELPARQALHEAQVAAVLVEQTVLFLLGDVAAVVGAEARLQDTRLLVPAERLLRLPRRPEVA